MSHQVFMSLFGDLFHITFIKFYGYYIANIWGDVKKIGENPNGDVNHKEKVRFMMELEFIICSYSTTLVFNWQQNRDHQLQSLD